MVEFSKRNAEKSLNSKEMKLERYRGDLLMKLPGNLRG